MVNDSHKEMSMFIILKLGSTDCIENIRDTSQILSENKEPNDRNRKTLVRHEEIRH